MSTLQITLFGGTGFIGRRLASRLLAAGHRVRVAARHAREPHPALGEPEPEYVDADIGDDRAVAAAVEGADAVVNLVGAVALRSRQAYFDLHEHAARRVAEAARAAGVSRLVQVSALGVSEEASSAADRSKAAGERAVREAFPDAVIVRPSLVFGEGDHFFSLFDGLSRRAPVIPLIGASTRFQPVHVDDMAEALARVVERDEAEGRTYEIGVPRIYTLRELVRLLLRARRRHNLLLPLPYAVAAPLGSLLGHLPRAPFTREQVELMRTDKVIAPDAEGLKELGIEPGSVEEWLGWEAGAG